MSLQEILNSEMDLASVSAAAGRAWRWWVAELAAMLPPAWRSGLSSRPRLFAEREASGWRYWRDGEPLADDRPPPGAQRGLGLLLPGEAVLVRRIEVPRMPAADVQVPFSVGFVWFPSVGMRVPFGSVGVHMCAVSLHQLPVVQSASTLQPPSGSHFPFVLHIVDWHTALGPGVQGPSPFA